MKVLEGIRIRKALISDLPGILSVVKNAFENMVYSDQSEEALVKCLVSSTSFVPSLSIVAEHKNAIVGHILLTRITIEDNKGNSVPSLALAPLAVEPIFHRKGIGTQLIKHAHSKALNLGYQSIIVVGDANYYTRFGYHSILEFNVELPFDVSKEHCLILELIPGILDNISGVAKYAKCFQTLT